MIALVTMLTGGGPQGPAGTLKGNGYGDEQITIMLPGDVPLVMVRIPAGSFVMGSPLDERGQFRNEGPLPNVALTQDLYMDKYQVTHAQWLVVMGREWQHLAFCGRPNNPMERVSWNDAQSFIGAPNSGHTPDPASPPSSHVNPVLSVAPPPGLEPGTYGLTVRRSTN